MSHKIKYTLYSLLILSTSAIYFALAYVGHKEGNLKLEDGTKIVDVVTDIGIANRKSSKHSSQVCYFQLASIEQKLGVYRATKNYSNILNTAKPGSELTVYYRPNSSKNINIDVMQVDFEGRTLYQYEEYKDKEDFLVYIGLIAGIGTVIGSTFYFRKHVLFK